MKVSDTDLQTFQKDYRQMAIQPSVDSTVVIQGKFEFTGTSDTHPTITDSYELKIVVDTEDSRSLPDVYELGGKIPPSADWHVNQDSTVCLGSPLGLQIAMGWNVELNSFVDKCLVPYLYAISLKLRYRYNQMPFGELEHGDAGLTQDFQQLLGLGDRKKIISALNLLSIRKRVSNKRPCPCGCNKRLGSCPYHLRLNKFRKLLPRSAYRRILNSY